MLKAILFAPVAERATAGAAYGGAGAAVLFSWTSNDIAAFGGLVIGVVGLAGKLYFDWRKMKMLEKTIMEKPDCAKCPNIQ